MNENELKTKFMLRQRVLMVRLYFLIVFVDKKKLLLH